MRNQILGNRYRILDRIGEGGMAFVYVALDEKLGRKVAIKVLHQHMEKNADIRKRFQLEAQAISTLEHPNIVKIYDFSGSQSERLWIVTEVIRGKNLAQYVQQFTGGWLHPALATSIVREILRALEKAHSQGIVHRDIKPENVMVTSDGRVKLMDFGIAKDLGRSSMTQTGTFMGSPSYMSPEQIRGRDIDLRSDLYSLCVLFYEIVTGRLPYVGQTTHDVVLKIMEGEFTYPRFIVPQLPLQLNDMIVRGMSSEPILRFQTASEFGTEIEHFLSDMGLDESHIELERYFKDRDAWEARLSRSRFDTTQTGIRQGRMRPHLSPSAGQASSRQTSSDASQSINAKTGHHTQKLSHSQNTPSAHAQTEHMRAPSVTQPQQRQATDQRSQAGQVAAQQRVSREAAKEASSKDAQRRDIPPPPQTPAPQPAHSQHYAAAQQARYAPQHRPGQNPTPPPPQSPQGRQAQAKRGPTQHGAMPAQQPYPYPGRAPTYIHGHAVETPARPPHGKARRPRKPKRRTPERRAHYHRSRLSAPGLISYVMGVVFVGVVLFASIWGFWELQNRLSGKGGRPVRIGTQDTPSTSRPKASADRSKRRDGTPVVNKRLQRTPTKSAENKRTERRVPTPRPKSKRDNTVVRTLPSGQAVRDANLGVESFEIKKSKRQTQAQKPSSQSGHRVVKTSGESDSSAASIRNKSVPTSKESSKSPDEALKETRLPQNNGGSLASISSPSPQETQSEPVKDDDKEIFDVKPTTKGPAKLTISSQPAAEVYINGKRAGTTVDQTSDSGPISLSSGRHTVELRRQGYTTYHTRIELNAGEQKTLPRVVLETAGNSAAQKTALTLRVSHTPAQVTVHKLDDSSTDVLTLKSPSRVIQLEPGRYQIRVEYEGDIKERELNLTGAQGQLTFSADFKEKDKDE